MSLLTNSVGRKIIMAVTGLALVGFAGAHLIGNSTVFLGADWLNAYAEHLHELGPVVWIFRAIMLLMLCLHVFFAITLTLENWGANPGKYAVNKKLKTTFAGKTMIWTGVLLLVFIVYHLLQFTVRITPDIVQSVDAKGRYDVFTMVVNSFRLIPVSVGYIVAMIVLFLHTSHGIQSIFQTFGVNNDRSLPKITTVGKMISALFLVGFGAIPVLIITGILT